MYCQRRIGTFTIVSLLIQKQNISTVSQRLPGRPCLLDHPLDLLISLGWCPEPPKPCSALSKTPVDASLSSSQSWFNICFCSEILSFFFLNPKTSRETGPFFFPPFACHSQYPPLHHLCVSLVSPVETSGRPWPTCNTALPSHLLSSHHPVILNG